MALSILTRGADWDLSLPWSWIYCNRGPAQICISCLVGIRCKLLPWTVDDRLLKSVMRVASWFCESMSLFALILLQNAHSISWPNVRHDGLPLQKVVFSVLSIFLRTSKRFLDWRRIVAQRPQVTFVGSKLLRVGHLAAMVGHDVGVTPRSICMVVMGSCTYLLIVASWPESCGTKVATFRLEWRQIRHCEPPIVKCNIRISSRAICCVNFGAACIRK